MENSDTIIEPCRHVMIFEALRLIQHRMYAYIKETAFTGSTVGREDGLPTLPHPKQGSKLHRNVPSLYAGQKRPQGH